MKKWHISIFTRCSFSFRGSANWDMRCMSNWAFTSWPKYIFCIFEASNKSNCGCPTIRTIPGNWILFSISFAFIFRQYMNIFTWAIRTTTFTNYVTYSKPFEVISGVIYPWNKFELWTFYQFFKIWYLLSPKCSKKMFFDDVW